jgi:hypothetical protein
MPIPQLLQGDECKFDPEVAHNLSQTRFGEGGELQGAIGVSGAYNNQADEDCARAGIIGLNIE